MRWFLYYVVVTFGTLITVCVLFALFALQEVVICGYELAVGSCNELLCGVPWGLVVSPSAHMYIKLPAAVRGAVGPRGESIGVCYLNTRLLLLHVVL